VRLFCLLLALLVVGRIIPAAAEPRVALVIGNNAYTRLAGLANPVADASQLAQTLGKSGFEVISCDGKRPGCFDLTRDGLETAISQLKAKSAHADLAFVFYGGHGMESGGNNVFAPVDATIDCNTHQLSRGVILGEVLEALEGAKQKIIVLDACRDNPMGDICPPPAAPPTLSFRDFKIPDAGNFLLFSSTKPGQVALDGPPGQHSPFARALFSALEAAPAVHFHQVFDRVAKTVIETTGGDGFSSKPQVPEMLVRGGAPEACLVGAGCAADPQAVALREEVENLKREHVRDQELGETARVTLAQIEAARGKPLVDEERQRILKELKDAGRALVARNDERGERALAQLKGGDTAAAERLFQEELETREAEAKSEQARAAEQRKKAAEAARHLATLAQARDVAKAVEYYRRATELDPDDAQTWYNYGQAVRDAGHTADAKKIFAQQARVARAQGDAYQEFWAQTSLGDVAEDQGNLTEALGLYQSARVIAERESKAPPNSAGWRHDLAFSDNRVANVLRKQGHLSEALTTYRNSLAIIEPLARSTPDNERWQWDLSILYRKIGGILDSQGNLSEALKVYHDSLAIEEPLAKASPGNGEWQSDLSLLYGQIGGTLQLQGEQTEALQYLREALAIGRRVAAMNPTNAVWQHQMALLNSTVGVSLQIQGNLPEAAQAFDESLAIAKRLVDADPDNTDWQRHLASSYETIALVRKNQGKLAEALQGFRQSFAIIEPLANADPSNSESQHDLTNLHGWMADIYLKISDWDKVLASLEAGRAVTEKLTQLDPNNAAWKKELNEFEAKIAALSIQGDQAAAHTAFEANRFKNAARLQAKATKTAEAIERRLTQEPGPVTAPALLALSWYQLFSREFKQALASSERAIAINPEILEYHTNRAHALRFLGRPKAAEAVYLKYKGRPLGEAGNSWDQQILEDFEELKKRGLVHPQKTKIKRLLGSKAPAR